jgi:predicted metal-dependent phosphoesterase TrpH
LKNFDLHNHSNRSDGMLTPAALVELAAKGGCDALALTDHDTTQGLDEAVEAAARTGLRLISGVEISVTWRSARASTTLHIVGLNIDAANEDLQAGLQSIRNGRKVRAKLISTDFDRIGIKGTLEGAYGHAENPEMIGRTHFARHLAAQGVVRDVGAAFNRFLVQGKPGYVAHEWAELADAVAWIRGAGGAAVIAHPGRYKISTQEMRELLTQFKALGGEAIEVVTGSHTRQHFSEYARLAREFDFLASRGADYHGPGESACSPGKLPPLPLDLQPVWQLFDR